MKHIKSIYEEEIRKLINWDLINDIKDLSLEYLDEGFELKINFIKESNRSILFVLIFTHNKLIEHFTKFTTLSLKDQFYYEILLSGNGWSENRNATINLKEMSKLMYPKEKIKMILFK